MKRPKFIGDQVQEFLEAHSEIKDLKSPNAKAAKLAEMVNALMPRGHAKEDNVKRQSITQLKESGDRIPRFIGWLAAAMGTTVDDMLVMAGQAPPSLATKQHGEPREVASASLKPEEEVILAAYRNAHPAVQQATVTAAKALAAESLGGDPGIPARGRQRRKPPAPGNKLQKT